VPELLHIDLDGFFVAVERLHAPELRNRAVIIGGQPTAWGRVVAASSEAARRGVRPGLSLAVAAMKCPDAVFLDGSIERYLDASAAVDELLREPMAPVEWTAIDSVFLDLTGLASRLGPSRGVAERLQDAIRRELGFDVACGLAGTKTAAQIAARLSRPRGLLYVLPGYEARLLSPLDVDLLPELPPGARQRLVQHGAMTIGALGRLSADESRELLGARGPVFVERARGVDSRGVDGAQPPRSIAREITLAEATVDEARLVSVMSHACHTLSTRLTHMGWFAHGVTLRLTVDQSATTADDGASTGGSEVRARPTGVALAAESAAETARPETLRPETLRPETLRSVTRTVSLREATARHDALLSAARALLRVVWRHRPVLRVGVALSNLQRVGPQMPLFPLSERWGPDATGAGFRTRQGLRSLVEGRYLDHRPLRRRAG
jgi:DNA polymerase IV